MAPPIDLAQGDLTPLEGDGPWTAEDQSTPPGDWAWEDLSVTLADGDVAQGDVTLAEDGSGVEADTLEAPGDGASLVGDALEGDRGDGLSEDRLGKISGGGCDCAILGSL